MASEPPGNREAAQRQAGLGLLNQALKEACEKASPGAKLDRGGTRNTRVTWVILLYKKYFPKIVQGISTKVDGFRGRLQWPRRGEAGLGAPSASERGPTGAGGLRRSKARLARVPAARRAS